jgi:hypothetical protein
VLRAATDAVALLAFVVVGVVSHEHSLVLRALAHDALPLLAGWFGVALASGAYTRGGRRQLLPWCVGLPLGVLARALWLGHPVDGKQAAFLVTTLVFAGAFVLAGRLALRLVRRPASTSRS